MDAMGHVSNTIYFRCLEVARLDWLFKNGGPPDANGCGPVIVTAQKSAPLPDWLRALVS